MYHCHVHFCLSGYTCNTFEIVKEISPFEHFTHEFFEKENPEAEAVAKADVIMLHLQGENFSETVRRFIDEKKPEAELILLAKKEQIPLLEEYMAKIKDIWVMPMSDAEVRFRFLRWQQHYKKSKDYWQTNQFFESTINNIPSLVWYKDKNGIHEKVNDSFCKTVNKTKKQVEGRGHAYIWDVEHDDPACIESEREVMDKRQTIVSEETIKTGEGMRLLTTYKSPLYDLDGSVMGTVGVAIDITQERAYEQEIMRKNQILEMIFTSMECGILCHSLDGSQIISVNRAALEILGYRSQEELEDDGFDMVAESVMDEDKPKLRECITKLKKTGDSINMEYRVQHKDGEILHVMGNIKLLEENGEMFYQRFLLNITEQKQEERKKERHQEGLLRALSIDYRLVCFFDLNTGMGLPIQIGGDMHRYDSIFCDEISLEESMEQYICESVYEEDRAALKKAVSLDFLKNELAKKDMYHINYRTYRNQEIRYFQMKVVRAGEWSENHGIVLGFRSVDEEIGATVREALREKEREERAQKEKYQ